MAWYEQLFDQEDPHRLGKYAETDESRRQVDFIVERLGLDPGSRILDLCCGQGRHLIDLTRRGYDVVGVDLSSYMLEQCEKAAKEAGIHSCIVRSDMREITFYCEFDAVINMWTSFGYLESDEEDQKALDRVSCALKPGGRFLMDMINRDRFTRQMVELRWIENERGDILLNRSYFDPLTGRNTSREITIFADGRRAEANVSLRLYTYNEIQKMLATAGLKVESVYGDFDSSGFSLESKRMMLVARKPE